MGYVGPALPGVEVRIASEDEVQMRSPMNMMGYYRNDEGTRACFTADGFFRTGDKGELAPDGQLKIVGRIKEQFKTSKGKYVSPVPIEKRFSIHPALEATCVMGDGRPHPFAHLAALRRSAQAVRSERAEWRSRPFARKPAHPDQRRTRSRMSGSSFSRSWTARGTLRTA